MSLRRTLTRRHRSIVQATVFATALLPLTASAQTTTLNASSFALRTGGIASGTDLTLTNNNAVGTYITLAAPATVSFTINASGQAAGGAAPRMDLVVGDNLAAFDVASGFNNYSATMSLPAGTHFVRTDYSNDVSTLSRQLTVRNLQVTGATVSNSNSNTNALAAANTYINTSRKGNANVHLVGPGGVPLLAGSSVAVDQKRNAFRFGTEVGGTDLNGVNSFLAANPAAGSNAQKYQQRLLANFNSITPGNAGKWASNEANQNIVTMQGVDRMLTYAQQNGLRVRMHNMIWGSQQPNYINTLLGTAATDATAKASLSNEVSQRVQYYIHDRATKFDQVDVYNESVHTNQYWNVYGAAGVADIYNQVANAAQQVGANTKTFVNEYNVFADGTDPYANWYARHIEAIREAGGNVGGIGAQYYVNNATGTGNNVHTPSRMFATLQNLAVQGLPIELTEFGVKTGTTPTVAAQELEDSVRLMYGTPEATGFTAWGFWANDMWDQAPAAAFYDANWNITEVGLKWQALMAAFDTNLTTSVGANGLASFNGFFGDYGLSVDGVNAAFTLAKGTSDYNVQLAAPAGWQFWNATRVGSWSDATNWTNGIAGGVGVTAHFGSASAARAVTLDNDLTLGQINFDSANAYTITGSGTITLHGLAGETALNVVSGNHRIDAPLVLPEFTRVWIPAAGSSLTLGDLADSAGTITKTGLGTLRANRLHIAGLNIQAGNVGILAGGANDNVVGPLTIAAGASFDIADASVTATLTQDAARDFINAGRIVSSLVDANSAIGYRPAGSDLLIRLTLKGDATLDGRVGFADLVAIAQNYQQSGGMYWSNGDINADGTVNFADLVLLAQNYGQSRASTSAVTAAFGASFAADWSLAQSLVPEPTSLVLLASVSAFACRRRR